jgi:hypothetical protein
MLSLCSPAAAHLCACCCARSSSCCFRNVYISACLQHAGGLAWCHAQAERVNSYAPQCDAVRVLGMCPAVGVVPPCCATSYQHPPHIACISLNMMLSVMGLLCAQPQWGALYVHMCVGWRVCRHRCLQGLFVHQERGNIHS